MLTSPHRIQLPQRFGPVPRVSILFPFPQLKNREEQPRDEYEDKRMVHQQIHNVKVCDMYHA